MKFFPAALLSTILCGAFTAAQAGIVEFAAPGPNGGVTVRIAGETIRLSTSAIYSHFEGYDFTMLEDGSVTVTMDLGSGPTTYNVIESYSVTLPSGSIRNYTTHGALINSYETIPECTGLTGTNKCFIAGVFTTDVMLVLESPDGTENLVISWWKVTFPGGQNQGVDVTDGLTNLYTSSIGPQPFRFELTYADAQLNTAPVANAGEDQLVEVGTRVYLDRSNSYDDDGQELRGMWAVVSKPAGSAGGTFGLPNQLFDSNNELVSFVPDIRGGEYVLRLKIIDSHFRNSAYEDVVKFTTLANVKPVAVAGDNFSVVVGDVVQLNGSATDANEDALTALWTITQRPAGSVAAISQPTLFNTQFVPDLPGLYELNLVANDGWESSDPSTIQIVAISLENSAINKLNAAITQLNLLAEPVIKSDGARNRLTGKIIDAIAEIEVGNISRAISVLSHNVLTAMNGCVLEGIPAKNDIVGDCSAQSSIYPLIADAIDILNGLN